MIAAFAGRESFDLSPPGDEFAFCAFVAVLSVALVLAFVALVADID